MIKLVRRAWKYMTASLGKRFGDMADPAVQLDQAIAEAHQQHRRLKEQAANVIANQKQTQAKLDRAMDEQEKVQASARQALLMADEAARAGDTAKATEYSSAAESFATRLIAVEREVDDLRSLLMQTTEGVDQAKAAVKQNSLALQNKISERQQLMSKLEQAKMSEEMSSAMASLSETIGDDVPSFDEVRDKIEGRLAKAQGRAELEGDSVESRMLEVEHAAMNAEAQARLSQLRSQLGLGAAPTELAAGSSEPSDDTEIAEAVVVEADET